MKQIYLILILCTLVLHHSLLAQSDLLSRKISFEKEQITFSQLRFKIEDVTGLSFVFNTALIKDDKKISIPSNEPTLKEVLNHLSATEGISYVVKGKTVVLKKKIDLDHKGSISKITISGYIKDAATNEVLIGASVYIKELQNGMISNNYGYYSLTVPQNDYLLQVAYVGYETFEERMIVSNDISKDILLAPSTTELDEVIIRSQVEEILTSPNMGVSTISRAKLKNQPSLLGEPDLIRVLLTVLGVNNIGEGSSGFNVRGGNTDQNLILLDEAPIYNSSHLFGFFSVFNSDAIKNSKLYKNIPARFGGRVSSVLDIHQKDGNDHFGGSISLGGIIERGMIEGPTVKGKGSFIVAGRVFNPLLSLAATSASDIDGKSSFGFYDLSAKINHTLSHRSKLFLSLYSNKDKFTIGISDNETSTLSWENQTTTLRWNKIFSPQLFSNFTGLYSNYSYEFEEQFGEANGKWKARVSNYTLKSDFGYFPSPKYSLEFGVQGNLTKIEPGEVKGNIGFFSISNSEINDSQKGLESSAYVSLESQLTKKLLLQSGLRYTFYGLLGEGTVNTYAPGEPLSTSSITSQKKYDKGEWIATYSGFEPRLLISYQLLNKVALKANYQRTYQYLQLISNTSSTLPIDIWKLSDTYVRPLYSDMYSGGVYWANNRLGMQASLEVYHKTLNNFIEYKNGANLYVNSHIETELLPGDGKAHGFEVFLLKTSNKTEVELAYTYSRTIRNVSGKSREETINGGRDYPSNFDQPHVLSLSLHHQLSEKWDINTLFTLKTGRPITLPGSRYVLNRIEADISDSDIADRVNKPAVVYEHRNRNDFRIPDFHRLDLSFGYKPIQKKGKKRKVEWSFGLYNLYGRKNAFTIAFNTSSSVSESNSKASKISIIGIPVPYFSYTLKF